MSIEVLIVDEDEDVLEITEAFLGRQDGLSVATETDPTAARDQVVDGAYDAVVTDLTMPGLNGIELCRAIRAERPTMPVLLFTGRDETGLVDWDTDCLTAIVTKGTGSEQYEQLAEDIREAV